MRKAGLLVSINYCLKYFDMVNLNADFQFKGSSNEIIPKECNLLGAIDTIEGDSMMIFKVGDTYCRICVGEMIFADYGLSKSVRSGSHHGPIWQSKCSTVRLDPFWGEVSNF